MNKEDYQKSIRKQKRNKKSSKCCFYCGKDETSILEEHHVDGRANSNYTVLACKNCHSEVSRGRNALSPKDKANNSSILKKKANQLINHGSHLKLLGEQQIELGYEILELGG